MGPSPLLASRMVLCLVPDHTHTQTQEVNNVIESKSFCLDCTNTIITALRRNFCVSAQPFPSLSKLTRCLCETERECVADS